MRLLGFALVLALSACGVPASGPTAPAGAPPSTPVQPPVVAQQPAGKPAEPAPAPTGKPGAVIETSRAATLVGRWGDNGDCTKDVVFRADGSFHSYTGGEGRWALNGDHLTMTGSNGVFELGLRWQDNNHMQVINPDGSVGTSNRC